MDHPGRIPSKGQAPDIKLQHSLWPAGAARPERMRVLEFTIGFHRRSFVT